MAANEHQERVPHSNVINLTESIEYLSLFIRDRLNHGDKPIERLQVAMPAFYDDDSPFFQIVTQNQLSFSEYVILLIGLIPHISPDYFALILDQFKINSLTEDILGLVHDEKLRVWYPTGETARFLLAGNDLSQRIEISEIFDSEHLFAKENILKIEEVAIGEPAMTGRIILDQEYVQLMSVGFVPSPRFGINFPAQLLTTEMKWEDLVLNGQTLKQVHELEDWIKHGNTLLYDWGMNKRIKPGYRTLFYGPPGTGKTLTASLLGKYTGREVYKVDLSMVVSKFIGETEKNLSRLFAKAENKDWILFFDEADSLFGKRTGVRDAHDKYANQEVSYLLQRVESYNGLVILASNFKTNIDEAFMRRFQSVIHFPMPKPEERFRIWELAFPGEVNLSGEIILAHVAKKYELSGSSIMNVVQYCCLKALSNGSHTVRLVDIQDGVRREFAKEGKVV